MGNTIPNFKLPSCKNFPCNYSKTIKTGQEKLYQEDIKIHSKIELLRKDHQATNKDIQNLSKTLEEPIQQIKKNQKDIQKLKTTIALLSFTGSFIGGLGMMLFKHLFL